MKHIAKLLLSVVLLTGASGLLFGQGNKPKSIIHVVTLYWKEGTTPEQKQAVLKGVEKMAKEIPGITNVWLKSIKVQGGYTEKLPNGELKTTPVTDAFVMEFKDEAAFKAYADHPAHREWEKIYIPVRGRSFTSDITN
jgi:Stress responsive A/B Barrel Domain.